MDNKTTLYARMLSGNLSSEEILSLKASCEWNEIQRIVNLMDEVELPLLDKDKQLELIKEENLRRKPKSKVRTLNTWWKISAAASIILFLGLFMFQQNSLTTVSTRLSATKMHEFLEGSQVVLNDGSQVSFNDKKWDENRTLDLKGEAFFNVEKGNPFIVKTNKGSVEVLGTSFNVNAWGANLSVQCYSGKVRVVSNNQEFILTKGTKVRFENGIGVKENHDTNSPTWTQETSSFYNSNLNEVFNEMERQFDITINTQKFNKKFTGTFTHNSLEQALYSICKPMSLEFKIDNSNKTVTILE